jgi:hypothetical protein
VLKKLVAKFQHQQLRIKNNISDIACIVEYSEYLPNQNDVPVLNTFGSLYTEDTLNTVFVVALIRSSASQGTNNTILI